MVHCLEFTSFLQNTHLSISVYLVLMDLALSKRKTFKNCAAHFVVYILYSYGLKNQRLKVKTTEKNTAEKKNKNKHKNLYLKIAICIGKLLCYLQKFNESGENKKAFLLFNVDSPSYIPRKI